MRKNTRKPSIIAIILDILKEGINFLFVVAIGIVNIIGSLLE